MFHMVLHGFSYLVALFAHTPLHLYLSEGSVTTERHHAVLTLLLGLVLLSALMFNSARIARADTITGGILTKNTLLKSVDTPFLATSDIIVDNGAVLTIEAGVTVRFKTGVRCIVRNGSLRALGTVTAPILLTSWRNTSGGLPARNDWGGIQFFDNTNDATTLLQNVTISFGTTTTLAGASPTFNNCRFENNSGYALAIDLSSFPHGSGNSAVGNGYDRIRVASGEMTDTGAWDMTAIPYHLDGQVSVGSIPVIATITPLSIEQGSTTAGVIAGVRLSGAQGITFDNPAVTGEILAGGTDTSVPVRISVGSAVPLGAVGFGLLVSAGAPMFASGITVIPPIPRITSILPSNIYINRPESAIELTGGNFQRDSVIILGGTPVVTTYVDATTLRGAVPLQLLQGVRQVQVRNPDPRQAGAVIASNSVDLSVDLPQLTLTPGTLTIRQSETGTLTLAIPFAAPAGGLTVNIIRTDPATATSPATVTIPAGSTSATFSVTAPDTAQNRDVTIEIHADLNNWLGSSARVTVRPEPTVNLTPTSLLSGQGFSFFLTISLTDPAPSGGLTLALSAATANVVTFPASVTVPAGATQAQVTVVNTGTGSTILTATPAVGKGFSSGDACAVTVKPVQTYNIGPVITQGVGVQVGTPSPPVIPPLAVKPLLSRPVGVMMGATVTGLSPDRAVVGAQNQVVRVLGVGLGGVTDISFAPVTGITIHAGSLNVATDGTYAEITIDIAADAPVAPRVVTVKNGKGIIPPATPEANRFLVTYPAPQLWSLLPNNGLIGSAMTLQVSGRNLYSASAITFEPPDGITVGSSISVSADGAIASAALALDATAVSGKRVARITTPAGTTTATMNVGNAFTILAQAGTLYTPVVSTQVGIMVPVTAPSQVNSTYKPLISLPVGVAVGPVLTGILPPSGAIGSNDLRVRFTGAHLSGVTSLTFNPDTGITITPGSLTTSSDGSYAEAVISIAANAPLTPRVVILKTASGTVPPATPWANLFRVTLPQPLIQGIIPLRAQAGTGITLSISGTLLSGATQVAVVPSEGITVANPPSVSSDGTAATVALSIAATAPTTKRVVTITTPGGTTTDTPSPANSFTVTADPGVTYTPILSRQVGVTVATAPPATTIQAGYGPIISTQVGVLVTPSPPPTTAKISYGSIISRPVGIIVGSLVTSMTPNRMEPGTAMTLTVTGSGLDKVTALKVMPDTGITVESITPSGDGAGLTARITVDAAASRGPRTVTLSTATGTVSAPTPWSNVLYVGYRPNIVSISPILQTVGNTFTLTINGTNLDAATGVRFEPGDGLMVLNPPVSNAAGTQATVTIVIDGMASGGQRVVVVDGPYGLSDNTSGANNTFNVSRPVVSVPGSSRQAKATLPLPRAEVQSIGRDTTVMSVPADLTMPGIPIWRRTMELFPPSEPLPAPKVEPDRGTYFLSENEGGGSLLMTAMTTHGYRGPPAESSV